MHFAKIANALTLTKVQKRSLCWSPSSIEHGKRLSLLGIMTENMQFKIIKRARFLFKICCISWFLPSHSQPILLLSLQTRIKQRVTRLENGPVISTDPDDWLQLNKEHCQSQCSVSGSFFKVPSPKKPINLKVQKWREKNFQPRGGQEEKANHIASLIGNWLFERAIMGRYVHSNKKQTLHLTWKREE